MSKIHFEKTLSSDFKLESIITKIMDFESYSDFMPNQLKQVRILKSDENGTVTEETISFQSIIKKTFTQQTLHKKNGNSLNSKIILGPAKNTQVNVIFEENEGKPTITVDCDIKLSLAMRIFEPLIKKYYKTYLNAFLNRLAISTT
mgnify:FL=1